MFLLPKIHFGSAFSSELQREDLSQNEMIWTKESVLKQPVICSESLTFDHCRIFVRQFFHHLRWIAYGL
ncbi:MAG: hypothetical protein COT73_10290 [Bdellovibrio sp. CG10_big_fil_rev_8_21_14_0_10_47_8]|nr:MAG: hypothetical protein COT73_10290 [Bdellovibrio sp. CG10_big_fil_rev_8_21_14_0_10_47_8]